MYIHFHWCLVEDQKPDVCMNPTSVYAPHDVEDDGAFAEIATKCVEEVVKKNITDSGTFTLTVSKVL